MKEFGGGSDCLCIVWALALYLRASAGFGSLVLKGKDIAAAKMTVQRPQPTKRVVH